jgi:saccharopine dehydrogenase-like NADP-dependent oxidoreductase
VDRILAADLDFDALRRHCAEQGYGDRVRCEPLDACDLARAEALMKAGPSVVLEFLPAAFGAPLATLAVANGLSFVNTMYATEAIRALHPRALAQGVTVLPEFGMDPGLDLAFLGQAVRSLDTVEEIWSYGAGFPEPAAADNALRYKVTWTIDGVLKSYYRPGRIIRDGREVAFSGAEMFRPDLLHTVELEGLGVLEAFPNGDALAYAAPLELDPARLSHMGRFVLRWPGHCAFWKALADLHLLDEGDLDVDGRPVNRRRFLAASLEPCLQYRPHERDVAVIRVEARGLKDGRKTRVLITCIDRRDLRTGLTAMSRTVGFTASIGAQMIGSGALARRGVLCPARDVPFEPLVRELGKRRIEVVRAVEPWRG